MDYFHLTRRSFLAGAGLAVLGMPAAAQGDATPVRIAFIGVGGRGTGLLKVLLSLPGTEVPAICDINEEHLDRAVKIVEKVRGNTPAGLCWMILPAR